MKTLKFWAISIMSIWLTSCVTLKPPTITKNDKIEDYKYVYITPTNSLSSSSGATYGGNYYSSSKSVNPSDIIAGILTKEGFIRLQELNPELKDQTLIVNYGESGRRSVGLGYTIEVTIQFISAKSLTQVYSCTAEGMGETETDDIRIAINRCLSALFSKQ